MSRPKDGYRLANPEERALLNQLGTCWVVRVGNRDIACPNKRLEGADTCAHHKLTDPLRSRGRAEEEEATL